MTKNLGALVFIKHKVMEVYMTVVIMITIFLGALTGYYVDSSLLGFEDKLIEPVIYFLIFVSGISIGYDINIKKTFNKIGINIISVPIISAFGSVIGGFVVGKFLGFSFAQSGAVASGLGWYSLSAIMISKYDTSLGAIAFLCNIFREILAFIIIPIVAKKIGYIESIGVSGATSMDTTLPAISRYTDENTTLLAFVSGAIMLIIVPTLVQFFIGLAYGV